MRDKDWRTLMYGISQGNCILVLGPEIALPDETPATGPDSVPLPPQFASKGGITLPEMLANQLCMEVQVTNLNSGNLTQVAEFYSARHGRNDLEAEAVSFYRTAPRSPVYDDLAKIPFNVVISLTHDTGIVTALEQQGRSPVVETYDFRGDQQAFIGLGRDGLGTAEKPLVYNLYGSVDTPRSLVLTESDILDFLSAVMSKNPELPSDLRSSLNDVNKSFLLLGFGLTRWYLRILLHVLKVSKRDTRSFALERLSSEDQALLQQTILFMRRGLKVESFDFEVASFVRELRTRFEASGLAVPANGAGQAAGGPAAGGPAAGGPAAGQTRFAAAAAGSSPLDAPKVFISYASEDEGPAKKLYDSLRAAGFEPWLDKEGLRGGDRWDDAIRDALDEVDYVVVVQSAALARKTFSYVNREIDMALQRQRFARRGINFVIPVRIDAAPPLEELRDLQSIDLSGPGGFKDLESAILRDQQRRKKRAA
ncbi:MAG TPA: toll/interleukin-1 receptor domain-containing protein [Thermoanaerobaculia bacterium]|jgi:hypothetical protein